MVINLEMLTALIKLIKPDMVNAAISLAGSCFLWANVRSLYQEKEVKGIHWSSVAFFTALGFWNLFYYSTLSQWYSAVAGISGVTANVVWLLMALWLKFVKWDQLKLGL